MAGISLNKINEEADERFGPFVIEDVPGGDVSLRNAMRLSKDKRTQIKTLQGQLSKLPKTAEDKALTLLDTIFGILAEGDGGKRLMAELADDPAKLLIVMEMYAEATQLGEALRSAS